MQDWEVVIGLEIHAQLTTKTKIFSGSSTAYGAEPNSQANLLDLGMPGQLPVLNKAVIPKAIRFGLAIGARIGRHSIFDRKNYFYPDLPKGYQTSQFSYPIVEDGGQLRIEVDGHTKAVGITRAHLEEDAGKSIHDAYPGNTGVDLNRAGTPLLEIVSEPDMRSAQEAVAFARKMHELVQFLEICDGNMQEGSFRVDSNVSIHRPGTPLGTRAELKNINSFRFIEQAIEYEVARQIEILESGGQVVQETRLYDPERNETRSMREKEEANDYRYFPCPDLLPVVIEQADIDAEAAQMPELPDVKRARYQANWGLSAEDASTLTASRAMADYFETLVDLTGQAKTAANWVMGDLSKALNQAELLIDQSPVTPKQLAGLMARIEDGTLSGKMAKEVFVAMFAGEGEADVIIEAKGLKQITDENVIADMVATVLAAHPDQVAAYQAGQTKMLGFFVGQVMKASQGKANPAQVNQILKQKLT